MLVPGSKNQDVSWSLLLSLSGCFLPLRFQPLSSMSAKLPPPHVFSFLSNSQRKKQTSSRTSLDQIQKPFSSHLNYADLLTFDLGGTEGKGDMNLATEFDLFSSLGNSGEGFSGDGGERRAEGELRKCHLLWEDFMPPIPS